jgi:hypothetical protein
MSAHSKNSIFSILLLLFVIVLAIGETKIAARAPRKENVAMNLHHLLLRESRTRVQVVHVLRDEQELVGALGKVRYRFVCCIWLCVPGCGAGARGTIPKQVSDLAQMLPVLLAVPDRGFASSRPFHERSEFRFQPKRRPQ